MIWYGVLGGKELVNRTYKNLDKNVHIEVCALSYLFTLFKARLLRIAINPLSSKLFFILKTFVLCDVGFLPTKMSYKSKHIFNTVYLVDWSSVLSNHWLTSTPNLVTPSRYFRLGRVAVVLKLCFLEQIFIFMRARDGGA